MPFRNPAPVIQNLIELVDSNLDYKVQARTFIKGVKRELLGDDVLMKRIRPLMDHFLCFFANQDSILDIIIFNSMYKSNIEFTNHRFFNTLFYNCGQPTDFLCIVDEKGLSFNNISKLKARAPYFSLLGVLNDVNRKLISLVEGVIWFIRKDDMPVVYDESSESDEFNPADWDYSIFK